MKVLIIEDETPALTRIMKLVSEIDPAIEIMGTADSIVSATELFKANAAADLALMDIELADGQSFEIFNRVQIKCPVIFTTAYDEFALRAFKVNSIDYLLKPIERSALEQALHKFRNLYQKSASDYETRLAQFISELGKSKQAYKNRFLVKNGSRLVPVEVADIAYFHAQEKLVFMATRAGNSYVMDNSLDEMEAMLDPAFFFRANRQYLVHLQSIEGINTWFNGKLKLSLVPARNEEVLVSRDKASAFKEWLSS